MASKTNPGGTKPSPQQASLLPLFDIFSERGERFSERPAPFPIEAQRKRDEKDLARKLKDPQFKKQFQRSIASIKNWSKRLYLQGSCIEVVAAYIKLIPTYSLKELKDVDRYLSYCHPKLDVEAVDNLKGKGFKPYFIQFVKSPLSWIGEKCGKYDLVCIIIDKQTRKLFKKELSILRGNKRIGIVEFTYGEKNKNLETVSRMVEKLDDLGITKNSAIIGFGGGQSLDVAGFTAGIYLRGIDFYQVPTTLHAMSDCTVGENVALTPQTENPFAASITSLKGQQ